MSKSKGSKNGIRKGRRNFNRAHFEAISSSHAHTVGEIINMLKGGLIGEGDYVFTMDGLKAIAHETYRGAWINCSHQANPTTDWSRQVGKADARSMIQEAFTS